MNPDPYTRDAMDAVGAAPEAGDSPFGELRLEASSAVDLSAMRLIEARESERARLAHEIHDGPAQSLSNAIFRMQLVERLVESDPAVARAELELLRELLRRELEEIRMFISQLRPLLLDELGLARTIEDAAAHLRDIPGLTVTTRLDAPPELLDDAQRAVVLRVAQEALQNVRKHAAATSVTVITRVEGGEWVLEVLDDGRGFDVMAVAARRRRNFGLQFMRERAALIGARFDIRSRPGDTVVRLVIPIRAKGAEESL
jgi:signal transduction histidine kinase